MNTLQHTKIKMHGRPCQSHAKADTLLLVLLLLRAQHCRRLPWSNEASWSHASPNQPLECTLHIYCRTCLHPPPGPSGYHPAGSRHDGGPTVCRPQCCAPPVCLQWTPIIHAHQCCKQATMSTQPARARHPLPEPACAPTRLLLLLPPGWRSTHKLELGSHTSFYTPLCLTHISTHTSQMNLHRSQVQWHVWRAWRRSLACLAALFAAPHGPRAHLLPKTHTHTHTSRIPTNTNFCISVCCSNTTQTSSCRLSQTQCMHVEGVIQPCTPDDQHTTDRIPQGQTDMWQVPARPPRAGAGQQHAPLSCGQHAHRHATPLPPQPLGAGPGLHNKKIQPGTNTTDMHASRHTCTHADTSLRPLHRNTQPRFFQWSSARHTTTTAGRAADLLCPAKDDARGNPGSHYQPGCEYMVCMQMKSRSVRTVLRCASAPKGASVSAQPGKEGSRAPPHPSSAGCPTPDT